MSPHLIRMFASVPEPFYGYARATYNRLVLTRHPERPVRLGDLNPDKTFYVIRDIPRTVGLAGWYDLVIGYVDRAVRMGWIPIVDQTRDGASGDMMWNEFFYGPSPEYDMGEVMQSSSVVFAETHAASYKRYSRRNVDRRHALGDLIRLAPRVHDFVAEGLSVLHSVKSPSVAVRYRGTDYRSSPGYCPVGHARPLPVEEFCSVVARDLRRWGLDYGTGANLFVVTEEQESLDAIRRRFPCCRFVEKELYAGFKPGKYLVDCPLANTSPFCNNMTYLLEIYAMSMCDYLISGVNGGALMALNLNGNKYRGVDIISSGVS